jgi:hypothetical protein
LRRGVPSFIVEVRRRPRLAATSNPDAQSSETRSTQARFDRESQRASAAAFRAKKADPSLVDAASTPKGRILPSLVPDESLRRTLRDAAPTATESDPPSRAPKRPPVRPPKRRDQASKSPRRNPGFSSDENAPLAESASTTSHQTASAQSVDGGVSPRALSAKAKRKDKITISRDNVREKHLPNDQRSPLGTDSPATLPSIVDDRPPQSRKRTIIARYVFGDALKPGERWKRRLLTMR